ncbi:MAG: winged helix-turn-helix transcriptional regulator [Thermoplasmatales archaeon]|nr:winged helix-turn-helix transcriptional regulator [Thermoplasmatales archaeon]
MISGREVLNFQKRKELYDFINENPGLYIREISRKKNIPITTLLYHLIYLNKIGIIKEKIDGKFKRIFISNKLGQEDKEILSFLRNKNSCKILIYLLFSLSCSQIEISKDLEMPPSTVSYYLKKMINNDIIEEVPVKNGLVHPFSYNDKAIQRKTITSEKFYRRKTQEVINSIYKLLLANKHSLFYEDIIDSFIFINKYIQKEIDAEKQKGNINRGIIRNINDQIDSVVDLFQVFFNPPFCS